MSNSPIDLPERLLDAGATDFERRILEGVAQRKPSPETSLRMARALGVTATAIGTTAVATKLASDAAVAQAPTAVGTSLVWPWVSVGVLGLVIAGAVIGTHEWKTAPPEPRPTPPPLTAKAVVEPSPSAEPAAALAAPPPGPGATDVRSYAASASDLRDQIALIDAARSALASSSDRRALEILRRYQDKYPSGSFRPEAAALRVEVLVKLAERFVAEYRGSLLARRVAELTGVGRP
jgi:hypothetical protein